MRRRKQRSADPIYRQALAARRCNPRIAIFHGDCRNIAKQTVDRGMIFSLLAASEPVTTIDANFLLLKPIASHDLSDVQFIICVYTSGDACGIPDCSYYYDWTGTDLAILPASINLGGADMDVMYDETLVFPNDGAPSDTIIKVIQATEYFNESEDDCRVKGKHYATQVYLWDGKRVVLQSPEPNLSNWFNDYLQRWYYKEYGAANDTITIWK